MELDKHREQMIRNMYGSMMRTQWHILKVFSLPLINEDHFRRIEALIFKIIGEFENGSISPELATHQMKRITKVLEHVKLHDRRN